MVCVLLLLALAGLSTATASGETRTAARASVGRHDAVTFYTHEIRKYRTETWYWQRVMGVQRSEIRVRSLSSHSIDTLRHLTAVWRRHQRAASRHAHHPPHLSAFMCIHRHEGSWQDAGAPYWGGLQMNLTFQRSYGDWLLRLKGTADHWTPLEQIWTAVRAHRSQGFYPWPNTARYCGLI